MDDSGSGSNPQIGQIVKVLKGRDAGKYGVIIGLIDQRYALIADGDKRKFDTPKKKNLLHLQLEDGISNEVINSLMESGRVTNGKIRFTINRHIDQNAIDAQEKGERL